MQVVTPQSTPLLYTNVAADSHSTWAAGTTYNLNDIVKVVDQVPHRTFKSLRANNIGRYPPDSLVASTESTFSTSSMDTTVATKNITVELNKNFSAGMMVEVTKTTAPNTVYMSAEVAAYTPSTGALQLTVISGTGGGTHTNWSIVSTDAIGFWEDLGSTNQYKMLDSFVNTQTSNLELIDVKISANNADYLALFGLYGSSVDIEVWDSSETTLLWSSTVDLVYANAITVRIADWYEYFFGSVLSRSDIAIPLGAVSYDELIRIKIHAPTGVQATCGIVCLGRVSRIGGTEFGLSIGMDDYSVKTTDSLGRTTLTPGYYAKTNSLTLYLEDYIIDSVYKKLVDLRGVPTAWIGNNEDTDFESLIVYGTFEKFSITVKGLNYSYCDLTIKGLI